MKRAKTLDRDRNDRRRFHYHSLRTKLIIAFLVTVLLPLIGTGLYGNWTTSRTLQTQAIDGAQADLRMRAQQIESYLADIREDLMFLSQVESLTLLKENPADVTLRHRVEADFIQFAATHPGIFQIRYINAQGMEVIRIDAVTEGKIAVPPEQLQNKVDRYYFNETLQLNKGEVYVSPVDLNREHGLIQQPHTPTIRYATPVFNDDARSAGIVILNLYAQPFLRFASLDQPGEAKLSLVDQDGYYLVHPDEARQWGGPTDLNSSAGAFRDYPEAWKQMTTLSSGVISPEPENWRVALMEAVLPLGLIPGNDFNHSHVLVYVTVRPEARSELSWRLLYDVPRLNLFASVSLFRRTAGLILILAVLVALFMAVTLARGLTAPILSLTEEVRSLGQGRLRRPSTARSPAARPARSEIAELTTAFKEMSAALDQHLSQLTLLNQAGQRITARLEQSAVIEAVATALEKLFPVDFTSITLDGQIVHSKGDSAWLIYREQDDVHSVLQAASMQIDWHTVGLSHDDGPAGFLCCAPICAGSQLGLIELYGASPELGDAATGNLLAALAVQISIALDNSELYERFTERRQELQALLKQLISAQEEERRIVAYDIHDGLIQMLVAARLQLSNFVADRQKNAERAEKALWKGMDELGAAVIESRRVIEGLRPAALDDLGLVATIRYLAEETCASCHCELEFNVELSADRLPSLMETSLFRIMQEAINNARKYAEMRKLRIVLEQVNGTVKVEVRDWGKGFDLDAVKRGRGVGLMGMRERVHLLDGQFFIESTPGQGTAVRVSLPVPSITGLPAKALSE